MASWKAGFRFWTLVAAVAGYWFGLRRWMRNWGVSDTEAAMPLAGDDIVLQPDQYAMRGVTIYASPEAIWPWLVQIGQGRGGFYSYDWIENAMGLKIHSAREIQPELQDLKPGDRIRLTPERDDDEIFMEVAQLSPGEHLVLRTPGTEEENHDQDLPFGSWAFVLHPVDEGMTRLYARWRATYKANLKNRLIKAGIELAHFIMERKMLLTLKQRAEGGPEE